MTDKKRIIAAKGLKLDKQVAALESQVKQSRETIKNLDKDLFKNNIKNPKEPNVINSLVATGANIIELFKVIKNKTTGKTENIKKLKQELSKQQKLLQDYKKIRDTLKDTAGIKKAKPFTKLTNKKNAMLMSKDSAKTLLQKGL